MKRFLFTITLLLGLVFSLNAEAKKVYDLGTVQISVDTCKTWSNRTGFWYWSIPTSPFTFFASVSSGIITKHNWQNYIEYEGTKYNIKNVDKDTTFWIIDFGNKIYVIDADNKYINYEIAYLVCEYENGNDVSDYDNATYKLGVDYVFQTSTFTKEQLKSMKEAEVIFGKNQ